MPNDNHFPPEDVYPGIHLEWLDEGQILQWTISTASQSGVDAWFGRASELIEVVDAHQPIRMLFILSQYVTVTGYIRKRMADFASIYGQSYFGRVAFVITKSPVRGIIKIFAKRELAGKFRNVQFDVFYEYTYALAWIREVLENNPEGDDD